MLAHPTTILIIERHPLMRAAICNAIADEPDLTIGAISSSDLNIFQIVESLQPKVILFAVGNPGDDEFAGIRTLRAGFPTAIILALTSAEVPGQEQIALASGANDALPKTAQRIDLLNSLRKLKDKPLSNGASNSERRERGST